MPDRGGGALARKGLTLVESQSFYLQTAGGPRLEGELERAVAGARCEGRPVGVG